MQPRYKTAISGGHLRERLWLRTYGYAIAEEQVFAATTPVNSVMMMACGRRTDCGPGTWGAKRL